MRIGNRKIRWLHITDLHILLNDPSWTNFKNYLLRYFDTNPGQKPDFVVITGDYRNIQKNESFELSEDFIRTFIDRLGLKQNKDLFMVPGNHDTCPQHKGKVDAGISIVQDRRAFDLQRLLPTGLSPWEKKENAELWRDKNETDPEDYLDRLCNETRTDSVNENAVLIPTLLEGFGQYQHMIKRLISWYNDSGLDPLTPHVRKWENDAGRGFNIIHLNTALVADGSRCHYQALDLSAAQESLYSIQNGLPTIILAHNSFYDLHPKIQGQIKPAMSAARVCAWLCGDSHLFNTNKSIQCPAGVDVYYVPIFVCGKGAPDHNDSYSEHGFILYEVDGKNLVAQQIYWQLNKGIVVKPIKEEPLATPDVFTTATKRDRRLRIGYLSCNPSIKMEDKYHLGHAYFIHTMDQWQKKDNVLLMTSSYVSLHNRDIKLIPNETDYAIEMIQRWEECFDRQIKVVDIKQYLQEEIQFEDNEKRLLYYLTTMELKLDRNREWVSFIEKWNRSGEISDLIYDPILKFVEINEHPDTYTRDEVLSFVYLLYKRPNWYTSTWLVNLLHFWNNNMYSLIKNELGFDVDPNDIYIVEAKRNHYSWDAISYCAKRFSYMNFPKVEYFDSLLDKKCREPMRSSNKKDAVFLKKCGKSNTYSKRFKDYISEMFGSKKTPDEIANEYCDRLGL